MIPHPSQIVVALMGQPMSTEQLARRFDCDPADVSAAIEAAPDDIAGTCAGSLTGKDHPPIVWHLAADVAEVSP